MMTLEEYFRKQAPAIDHALRVELCDGYVRFYIHPTNVGGDTVNFEVHGNELRPDRLVQNNPGQPHRINLNGRPIAVLNSFLSYRDIVGLANLSGNPSCVVNYKGSGGFTMWDGRSCAVHDGMIINCIHTDNA
jgi:hypothetical protein